MASGLLGFLGFGKQSKPNLTQNYIAPPSASEAPNYQSLNELAKKRIRAGITGEETSGVGYGKDFVDRATNPAIANIDYNFQNRTMPLISSELSKRNVARSAGQGLATDVITKADQQRNLDVNELISKFYTLNEAQKKTDITQGIDVGKSQDAEYLNQGNERARAYNEAERGNTERTAAVASARNTADRARQNQTIGALTNMLIPSSSSFFSPEVSKMSSGSSGYAGVSGVKTNLLGASDEELDALYQKLLNAR